MRRSDSPAPIAHIRHLRILPDPATLPLPVYRDFVDMLFSMRLPIFGLGAVFVGICIIAGHELGSTFLFGLAGLGAVTTLARLLTIGAYRRAEPVLAFSALRKWEQRYAIGNLASAVLLAILNVTAISAHNPLLHLITVSLVFGFGAGIVARTSIRPGLCVAALLTATVPTVMALAMHAAEIHAMSLHWEMYVLEAFIVAAITGLTLSFRHDLGQPRSPWHHCDRDDDASRARTHRLGRRRPE